MPLPLQLNATYCLLWQKIYVICLKQLNLIQQVACGNYDEKLVVNPIVYLQIPCSDTILVFKFFRLYNTFANLVS
jgi:hypothetical protein